LVVYPGRLVFTSGAGILAVIAQEIG